MSDLKVLKTFTNEFGKEIEIVWIPILQTTMARQKSPPIDNKPNFDWLRETLLALHKLN